MSGVDAAEGDPAALLACVNRLGFQRRVFEQLEWWPLETLLDWVHVAGGPGAETAGMCVVPLEAAPAVAWLRWVAVRDGVSASAVLRDLFERQTRNLAARGVTALWCICQRMLWLREYLVDNGFRKVDAIITLEQESDATRPDLPGLTIRPCRPEDIAAVAALDAAEFDAHWRYAPAQFRRALAVGALLDVALLDGRVAGYVCGKRHDDAAHIIRLAVDRAHARQGVGSALLGRAAGALRQAGAKHITLNTPASLPTLAFYKQNGFVELRERVDVFTRVI